MKKLLLFLTIFLFFTSCAQQEVVQKKEELKKFEKSTLNFDEATKVITFSNGENVTGIIFETWENGQLKEETEVKNGKFNGDSKRYYANGNLFQIASFQNGKPSDTGKVFYPDESLMSNYFFVNGKYSDGVCYDPSGEIINCVLIYNGINISETNKESDPKPSIIKSNVNGEPINGLLMKSYADGAPWYHQCYKNGVMHGYAAAWHENGELMYTTNYIDGKENGIQRQYYTNGQMISESEYNNHVTHGFQKIWYEDGTLKAENNFLNGEPHGSVKRYDAAGKLIKHGTFENGVLVSEDCFENGKKVDCE